MNERKTVENTLDPTEIVVPGDDEISGYTFNVLSAKDYLEQRNQSIIHLLSNTPIDELLKISGKGLESASVSLIFGENAVGKTQFAHTLTVLNPYDVVYIDTEDTFRPERLREIAETRSLPVDDLLERVHIMKPINASHLEYLIAKMPSHFMELKEEPDSEKKGKKKVKLTREWRLNRLKTGKIGLVILDSLAPPFRTQYQGRERLNPRQSALLRCISYLKLLSIWFNCVVIVIDQIIENPSGGASAFMPPWVSQKPVGGPTVKHNIDLQLRFRRAKGNVFIASVVDSSNVPLGEKEFVITARGVDEVPLEEDKKVEVPKTVNASQT